MTPSSSLSSHLKKQDEQRPVSMFPRRQTHASIISLVSGLSGNDDDDEDVNTDGDHNDVDDDGEYSTAMDLVDYSDGKSLLGDSTTQGGGSGGDLGISEKEKSVVRYSRWLFLGTLLLFAASLSSAVYVTLSKNDKENFVSHFEDTSVDVVVMSNNLLLNMFQQIESLATTATSAILEEHASNTTYPHGFITIPHVEHHLATTRNNIGAIVIGYCPLVQPGQSQLWFDYTMEHQQQWIEESNGHTMATSAYGSMMQDLKTDENAHIEGDHNHNRKMAHNLQDEELFAPLWTYSPPPLLNDTQSVGEDLLAKDVILKNAVHFMQSSRNPVLLNSGNHAAWLGIKDQADIPQTGIVFPIFDDFTQNANIVGFLIAVLPWETLFDGLLTHESDPVNVVLKSSCGDVLTFDIHGSVSTLIAQKDAHDVTYDHLVVSDSFAAYSNPSKAIVSNSPKVQEYLDVCVYQISVFPTRTMQEGYESNQPLTFALFVAGIFLVTAIVFFIFDLVVQKHQQKVIQTAKRQNAIVSSLFPKNVQAKLMAEVESAENRLQKVGKAGLKTFLVDSEHEAMDRDFSVRKDRSKPIADLFPETTVMFADIAGFTAWSSAREPSQVFTLLETIYHEFDSIAKRRRVFKVEVVGDCYVAACGLPDPCEDHAIVMVRFAGECLSTMMSLTHSLEVELGPDTTDLGLRVGLHSGPVVAGVLRGEKARFQLFGDTMNTAARMESTGVTNKIQMSQETADLLRAAGKFHWCEPRSERVEAKGKGALSTYFLKVETSKVNKGRQTALESEAMALDQRLPTSEDLQFEMPTENTKRLHRIAGWTVELLSTLLKEIEVRRRASQIPSDDESNIEALEKISMTTRDNGTVIDEVQEIIHLPEFDPDAAKREAQINAKEIHLDAAVLDELNEYVRTIASMYHENSFHNFPHANHVTLSVSKLLSRIVAPDVSSVKTTLHDHTYGITSDPLTRFAVVFSALIHDVDHYGVSNAQLVAEKDPLAKVYKEKSVAEQNSIDVAWLLLMEPRFQNLRRQIYTTEAEFKRFRQLVVNTVMATDIMDKDLKMLRNKRWADAFAVDCDQESHQAINRKATIVIEHLIQASDVAHTMQHWHIFRKWNERLFQEMYKAFKDGRMAKDPSEFWYEGELSFFDFYIIPLAKKLKECGVFGVSSDEYLGYAMQNRKEWADRGKFLVEEMVQTVKRLEESTREDANKLNGHSGRETNENDGVEKAPPRTARRNSLSRRS